MAGEVVRMVQMRNPWNGHDGWTGDYSDIKGGEKFEQLKEALNLGNGFVEESGKYWMSFDDFTREYADLVIGHSQETRTVGGEERAEYRPTIDLNEFETHHFVRITMFDDLDLTNDVFTIDNL